MHTLMLPFGRLTSRAHSRLNFMLMALFFLLATTWLFAPLVAGNEYGSLRFISNYEGHGQLWSWLFRASDITASVLLAYLIYRFHVWQKDRPMAVFMVLIAALAAIDSIFALDCKPHITYYCVERPQLGTIVHDQESLISAVVIAGAIIWDVWRRRRAGSIAFLSAQIAFAVLAAWQPFPRQQLAVLQFLYEVVLVLWLIYALEAFAPAYHFSAKASRWYRKGLAYWLGASGIMTIITAAAHLRLFDPNLVLYFGNHAPWVAPQTAFFGVIILYLARQIFQGQRRAAYVVLIILLFEIIKYGLFEPDPPLLAIYLITFIVLFVSRQSFRRNIGPLTVHRRIVDFAVVIGGVAAALAIIIALLAALGRFQHVVSAISSGTGFVRGHYHHSLFLQGTRTRMALSVLGLSTLCVGVWALFRPSSLDRGSSDPVVDEQTARLLLEQFSRTSEDYFKLWPPDKRYFFSPDRTGFITYKYVGGTAFALNEPIASTRSKQHSLLKQFYEYCDSQGWTICFLTVDASSQSLYEPELKLLPVGSSAVINIATFNAETRRDKWWRWQYNRGNKAGLTYASSQPPHDTAFIAEAKSVSDAWLARPGHREQGFALGYFDDEYLQNCIIHYVRDADNQLVAFTNQVPVFGSTQTTVDLLRFLPDHDGAMPFLLLSLIESLGKSGEFITFDLGFVPLARVQSRSAQLIKSISRHRFSAVGLEQFKGKFKPAWSPAYIAYSGDIIDLAALAIKLESAFKPE